ncbi:cilia- and flagella-associated protein 46-like [Clytia hemisphaerica]
MDSTIRSLLGKAEQEYKSQYLNEAFGKLKGARTNTNDQTDPFHSDLYVICAEVALKLQEDGIVQSCMKLFFQKIPPTNQFLCRAYLCQAQLYAPKSAEEKDKLQICIGYLMKAINFAKSNARYHFLVYNASVLYWAFVRPFMRPHYRQYLTKSFHMVVKALDETNDPDYEWRAQLMVGVMECHIDTGCRDDALHVGLAALSFMKSKIPHKCKEIFILQLQHKLLEPPKIQSIIKGSPELSLIYRMNKIKIQGENLSANQINEMERIFKHIMEIDDTSDGRTSSSNSNKRPNLPLTATEKQSLLLDFAKLCCEVKQIELAGKSIKQLLNLEDIDERFACEVEFLNCQYKVERLGDKRESYSKSAIEVRLNAIETLSEHLSQAHRMNEHNLIQVGCVTMWNLCLPLLQNNLRSKVRKYLIQIAEFLEEIDSLLNLLRCQVHTEVAKCEENVNQLQSALSHLSKAMTFDDGDLYRIRIENSLNRIKLKALLYQVPERAEDHAAMIIEQAEGGNDSYNSSKMQVYLSKAGSLLAPDTFMLAIDGEMELSSGTPASQCSVEALAKRVKAYQNGMGIIEGHVKRVEGTDSHERIRLWADLVKVARKQNVWTVTRVASKFCLLYEDMRSLDFPVGQPPDSGKSITPTGGGEAGVITKEEMRGRTQFSEQDDITRIFAEINFIYAESLVQLLHQEGIELLNQAIPPKDTKLRPKKYQNNPILVEEMEEWKLYTAWIDSTCQEAITRFSTACDHGSHLEDPIIVCNAAIYVWNYTKHLMDKKQYTKLTKHYQPLFNLLRRTGHGTETIFLCDFTNALAMGYIENHMPSTNAQPPDDTKGTKKAGTPTLSLSPQMRKKSAKPSSLKIKGTPSATHAESTQDLQHALDVLEHTLGLISGNDKSNMVPIAVRHKLIKTQVLCKALMKHHLPKNLGHDSDSPESQGPMCKALFALEALSLKTQSIAEFSACPSIKEIIQRVENAKWTDNLLQLQVWSRIAVLTLDKGDFRTCISCCDKALKLESKIKINPKINDKEKHRYVIFQEMLHYASLMKGKSLVATMNGRNEIKMNGLNCFIDAARYASVCKSYDLVLSAARYYWNNICTSLSKPIERQLLQEPIKSLLSCINKVSKEVFEDVSEEESTSKPKERKKEANTAMTSSTTAKSGKNNNKNVKTPTIKAPTKNHKHKAHNKPAVANTNKETYYNAPPTQQSEDNTNEIVSRETKLDEDLNLRAALYGVLFQTFADKGDFEVALVTMDEAIKVMPRTHHRLVLFKHRVITEAKLNKPTQFDMGKFRYENENMLAQMWCRVAKHSKKQPDQLSAYINAIEALTSDENLYQKVDYLAEFGEWLFVHEYPVSKATDQFYFAISLVLNGMYGTGMPNNILTDEDEIKLLSHVTDIKQMDWLIRLYVMLSDMLQQKGKEYERLVLAAATLVQRIWKVSIGNAEKAIKNGVPPSMEAPLSPKTKKASKTRPGSKSSSALPTSYEKWALFTLPEKLNEYFVMDKTGYYINKTSITRPTLSMFYYEKLCKNLNLIGYHHLGIPVLSLMSYLANDVLEMKDLTTLIDLKMTSLCEQLNMVNACTHYHTKLSSLKLTMEEQEASREEVEKWRERERQVLFEEQRQENETFGFIKSHQSIGTLQKHKPLVSSWTKREVWVQVAEYLIGKYQFDNARVYLEEASTSANVFSDETIKEMITFNYALISFQQRDWGKVMSTITSLKWKQDNQEFWLKKILLLCDAIHNFSIQEISFQNHIDDTGFEKAKKILQNAVYTIQQACATRTNGLYLGPYMKAKLLYRLGGLVYTESTEKRYRDDDKQRIALLKEACKRLDESLEILIAVEYKKDTVEVLLLKVKIQRELALLNDDLEAKKMSLVETLTMANTCEQSATSMAADMSALSSKEEMRDIFLPIQHDVIMARKLCVAVLYDILLIATEEKKKLRLIEEAKAPMERIIDEYVDITPTLSPSQQEWQKTLSTAAEKIIMMVNSIKTLGLSIPLFSAEASLEIGYVLKLLSQLNSASRYDSWDLSMIKKFVDGEEESDSKTSIASTPLDLMLEYEAFRHQQIQSVHNMTQALQIGLQHSLTTVVKDASYQLLDCVGSFDAHSCVQLLALFQSATASLRCQQIVERVFLDPNTSASASLYKQKLSLSQACVSQMDNVNSSLAEHEWYKRMSIHKTHLDIIKELPFNITYIILQHSPSKDFLYGGVLEKQQSSTANKKRSANRDVIGRISTNQKLLDDLLAMMEEFKTMVRSEHSREIYIQAQIARRHGFFNDKKYEEKDCELKSELEEIKNHFDALITTLEAYMGPLLTKIHQSLSIDPIPQTVVILADEDLLEFPLECLSVFRRSEITTVSRDFSLQFFYHRFKRGEVDFACPRGEHAKSATPVKIKSDKGSKDKAGGKNAAKHVEKKSSSGGKEFTIDKENIVVDISQLKYLLDPLQDGIKGSPNHAETILEELTSRFKGKVSKWSGIKGSEDVTNAKEMQLLLQISPAFLFHGYERLLALLPAFSMLPLDLSDCMMALLVDHVHTAKSNSRQGSLDTLKSPSDLDLERPVYTAMILSLCGVSSVLSNQWYSSESENKQRVSRFFTHYFEDGLTNGQAARCLQSPKVEKPPVQKKEEEPPAEKTPAKGGKNKLNSSMNKSRGTPGSNSRAPSAQSVAPPPTVEKKVEKVVETESESSESAIDKTKDSSFEYFNMVLYGLPNLISH